MGIESGDSKGYSHVLNAEERLFFVLLRVALGVLLLSDVSFRSTYTEVYQFPVMSAGLSPLNITIADNRYAFNSKAVSTFWWFYASILSDAKNVREVEPLSCSAGNCNSYFMPGRAATVVLDTSVAPITDQNFTNALSLVQHDAPGYQIDFEPVQSVDPVMTLDDCRLYGVDMVSIQICLKKANSSLIAGSVFPFITIYSSLACVSL